MLLRPLPAHALCLQPLNKLALFFLSQATSVQIRHAAKPKIPLKHHAGAEESILGCGPRLLGLPYFCAWPDTLQFGVPGQSPHLKLDSAPCPGLWAAARPGDGASGSPELGGVSWFWGEFVPFFSWSKPPRTPWSWRLPPYAHPLFWGQMAKFQNCSIGCF